MTRRDFSTPAARVMAAVVVTWLIALFSAPAASAAPDAAQTGVDRFGACLNAERSGQVLLLVDESRSLGQTDPQAQRVTAAKYLAERLKTYATDTNTTIDIAVSGFADEYHSHLGWTTLDDSSIGSVTSTLDGLTDRTAGQDTDYWVALEGARSTLAEKSSPADLGRGCKMIAWFTDGELDYSNRADASKPYAPGQGLETDADRAAMAAAARESICRPGGLADQLRSSDIITIAIGLTGGDDAAGGFSLLEAIATGDPASGETCGDITEPTPGDFYPVDDIDELLFAFDSLIPGSGTSTQETGVCAGSPCDEAKHRFVLDRSVGSVNILASADATGLVPYLIAPDGQEIRMDPGASGENAPGGVAMEYSFPTDKTVAIHLANSDADLWSGAWAFLFVAPDAAAAQTRSSIQITGDLRPEWAGAQDTSLHSGDSDVEMGFSLVDAEGQPVDVADLPGTASLDVELVPESGSPVVVAEGLSKTDLSTPQTLDLTDVAPGPAKLRMTLSVTTAPAEDAEGVRVPGTELSPVTVDLPVAVETPVGYPQVAARVDFGTVEGAGTATAALAITGSGCVWLDPSDPARFAATPDGAGTLNVGSDAASQADCVQVGEGATGELPLRLEVPNSVNGTVNGTITVAVAAADGSGEPMPIEVPFTAALQKPMNTTNFVIALVVALVLGPLIPLLMLYFFKWLTARIPARALRAEQIPVTVSGSSVTRDGGAPFEVRDTELVSLVPGLDKPARSLDLGPVKLRTRIGKSPFGVGHVVATAAGMAGAAGSAGDTVGSTPDARLPLAVHNNWLVLHDPTGPENAAVVVLLVSGEADRARVAEMARDITLNLPKVLPDLRAKAVAAVPGGAPPAGGNGPEVNPFGPGGGPSGPGPNPFGPAGAGGPGPNPFGPGGQAPVPPSGPYPGQGYPPQQQPPQQRPNNPFGPPPTGGQQPPGGPDPFRP